MDTARGAQVKKPSVSVKTSRPSRPIPAKPVVPKKVVYNPPSPAKSSYSFADVTGKLTGYFVRGAEAKDDLTGVFMAITGGPGSNGYSYRPPFNVPDIFGRTTTKSLLRPSESDSKGLVNKIDFLVDANITYSANYVYPVGARMQINPSNIGLLERSAPGTKFSFLHDQDKILILDKLYDPAGSFWPKSSVLAAGDFLA